jgi:hypothetical protein
MDTTSEWLSPELGLVLNNSGLGKMFALYFWESGFVSQENRIECPKLEQTTKMAYRYFVLSKDMRHE